MNDILEEKQLLFQQLSEQYFVSSGPSYTHFIHINLVFGHG